MKFPYAKLPFHGNDSIARPYLAVYLFGGEHKTEFPFYALLDSGADRVIFPEELARVVGIEDITQSADREPTIGFAGQTVDIYYHDLELQLVGDPRKLPVSVGFAPHVSLPLLGRTFFQHFTSVCIKEKKACVEVKV